jgi:DNA-binding transcriptional ArsR family regulator
MKPIRYTLQEPGQVAALGSAVRLQIADLLRSEGAASVRQLASLLGRSPESLHYHVRKLTEVGIVQVAGRRRVRSGFEAVYRLVAPEIRIDPMERSRPYLHALARSCAAMLRQTSRDYMRTVEGGSATLEGESRDLALRRHTVHLDPEGLARLNKLLDEIPHILRDHESSNGGQTFALTFVLTPLTGKEAPGGARE